jgi:uncharacterized protein (TIGR02996 family)
MTDAFYDALRADCNDDTTRLVFADWLEDHGEDDRAAFIRLAVRLERLPDDHPDRPELLSRYTHQFLTHGPRWLGERPDSLEEIGYRGGLVARVAFREGAAAADIVAFLTRHPVRELSVAGERTLRELAWSPGLGLVRSLVIRKGPLQRRARVLDELFDSPHLCRLQELQLSGEAVDNHLARVLATAPGLRGLVVLRLERTRLDDAGVVRLLGAGALPALEEWHVDCPKATELSLRRLFDSPRAGRLRALSCGPQTPFDGLSRCQRLQCLQVVLPSRRGTSCPMLGWLAGLSRLQDFTLSGPLDESILGELAAWPGLGCAIRGETWGSGSRRFRVASGWRLAADRSTPPAAWLARFLHDPSPLHTGPIAQPRPGLGCSTGQVFIEYGSCPNQVSPQGP